MNFILRILFSGLMAFVPSEDGKEVTVLLLNVDHKHASDGSFLPSHKPLLIARAGSCSGTCPTRDEAIATYLFADKTVTVAQDSLEAAVGGGGAWQLGGSELSVRKSSTSDPDLPQLVIRSGVRAAGSVVPSTSAEREDFSWVANLKKLCPTGCELNPAIFDANPPAGLVAARFRIRSGNVATWSIARIGSNVTPVHFKRLDGSGSASEYSQAITSWVGADIAVSASSIELVEDKFDGSASRTMRLTPDSGGKVEVAVLNLPPFVPPVTSNNDAPAAGKHFETYYELSQSPPAIETRLVPRPGAAPTVASYPAVGWTTVHPTDVVWSELLNALRLEPGRTIYDRTLCPPTQDDEP